MWLHADEGALYSSGLRPQHFGSSFRVEEKDTVRFAHCTRARAIAIACCLSTHCLCWDYGIAFLVTLVFRVGLLATVGRCFGQYPLEPVVLQVISRNVSRPER